jgi:hypothetical protein
MEMWLRTKMKLSLGKILFSLFMACGLFVMSESTAYSQWAYFNSGISSSGGGSGGGTVSGYVTGSANAALVGVQADLAGPNTTEHGGNVGFNYAHKTLQMGYAGYSNFDLVVGAEADWWDGYYEVYYDWHSLQTTGPQPTIGSISPSSGQAGQSGTMTIFGNSLQQAIEVFSDGPITFSIIYVSETSIQANYSIDPGASPGGFNVYVDFPTGIPGSNTRVFTITP